jgi:CTP:molybdopterin cytidylyltransferase MocA
VPRSVTAAVILAGGSGRRLGGVDKPALLVAERSLLDIAIAAVGDGPIVVVGPLRRLPAGVLPACEDPPGGGPAAGVAAGIAALPPLPDGAIVAVLAADLPGITAHSTDRLITALAGAQRLEAGETVDGADDLEGFDVVDGFDGAVLVDDNGRRQYLTGVWRLDRLRWAIGRRGNWHGAPLHDLLDPLRVVEVAGLQSETADVDTPADWERWQS